MSFAPTSKGLFVLWHKLCSVFQPNKCFWVCNLVWVKYIGIISGDLTSFLKSVFFCFISLKIKMEKQYDCYHLDLQGHQYTQRKLWLFFPSRSPGVPWCQSFCTLYPCAITCSVSDATTKHRNPVVPSAWHIQEKHEWVEVFLYPSLPWNICFRIDDCICYIYLSSVHYCLYSDLILFSFHALTRV